jgi:transcriptional regulator with XRE-family HTH domain
MRITGTATGSADRLAIDIGRQIRRTRRALRRTQRLTGEAVGLSQSAISLIERGRLPGVTLRTLADVCDVLEIHVAWQLRPPWVAGSPAEDAGVRVGPRGRQVDPAHARCNAYVRRRLERLGWLVAQEVEITMGRTHGFIDILAFHPPTRTLLIVEIKTELRDIGEVQRTLSWYEREAAAAARGLGWAPGRVQTSLLLLVTRANDDRVAANRELLAQAFPVRSRALARWLADPSREIQAAPALAMIDPTGRKRTWLRATSVDGRTTIAPYAGYGDFMDRIDRQAGMSGTHASGLIRARPPSTGRE